MPMSFNISHACKTDVGLVREHNEDSILYFQPEDDSLAAQKGVLAIVADGVGGNAGGEVASSMAVNAIRQCYYDDAESSSLSNSLGRSLRVANHQIVEVSNTTPEYHGMATTCTALVLTQEQVLIAHVGDSRAYRLRGSDFVQLTKDHSLVNELLGKGLITEEESKNHPQGNVITRALGSQDEVEVDIVELPVERGDCFCLCSDGLSNMVSDQTIAETLYSKSPNESCEILVELARQRGGYDNISVVTIKIDDYSVTAGTKTRRITEPYPNDICVSRLFLACFGWAVRLFSKSS